MDTVLLRKLHVDTFIAIDVETTGLDRLQDDIIELGAIKYINGRSVEEQQLLFHPRNPVPDEIIRLTGITNEMVNDAPSYAECHEEVKSFLGNYPLVAHNIEFDYGMLKAHYRRSGDNAPENPLYDTLVLARTFVYWLVDHKLSSIADAFGHKCEDTHRALADARMVGSIFLDLLEQMIAAPLNVLRQCTKILSDVDVHTKSLFFDMVDYLLRQNSETGIGTGKLQPPQRFNIYGKGKLEFDEIGEPIEPVDTFELTRHFTAGGVLGSVLKNFEERDAQASMAEAVADALNEGHILVAEAGTGVGKSLAYLLPSAMWTLLNADRGERVVISSNTKNLQEQLFYKDIPFIHDLLGFEFKAVLLKGRSNYLCKTRWTELLRGLSQFSQGERMELLPLTLWVSQTKTGDISENNGFNERRSSHLWSQISSESGYCTTRRCTQFQGCYLGPLKREAASAHILLVNHSLLLADATTNNMTLPEYHHLIVDEAHNIEKNAYRYFASEFDIWTLRNNIRPLYSSGRNTYGLLVTLKTSISKIKNRAIELQLTPAVQKVMDSLVQLEGQSESFLDSFKRHAARVERQRQYTQKVRYTMETLPFDSLGESVESTKDAFRTALTALKELYQYLQDYSGPEIQDLDLIRQDIRYGYENLFELAVTFKKVIEAKDSSQIYWYELPVNTRSLPKLVTTPIDVGQMMEHSMFDNLRAAVLTSATLKVADSFNYYLNRIGLDRMEEREIVTRDFGSPYYLSEQLIGCVTTWVDTPGSNQHSRQIADVVREISERYRRGTLVLTTSYQSMDDMYEGLGSYYRGMGIELLRQDHRISRTDLIEQFKSNTDSVLLGTESFWEGVDVPGKSLEVLIIGKLPFAVPSDPIVEANIAAIESAGGNGFVDYMLPEAIIQFRQGFGRLIRSSTDAGVVIIADPRVATKFYGRYVAESLPIDLHACENSSDLFRLLDDWFRRN